MVRLKSARERVPNLLELPGRCATNWRRTQESAPPQPDPDPAVHPKQWLAVLMFCPAQPEKLLTFQMVSAGVLSS